MKTGICKGKAEGNEECVGFFPTFCLLSSFTFPPLIPSLLLSPPETVLIELLDAAGNRKGKGP